MFNDVYGVVNLLLTSFHIIPKKIAVLATPETAMPVMIAVDVWKTVPFMALLILPVCRPFRLIWLSMWSYRSQNVLLFDASVYHANAACGTHFRCDVCGEQWLPSEGISLDLLSAFSGTGQGCSRPSSVFPFLPGSVTVML